MAKNEIVNIAAAKARLPELVKRASGGEEIILARNGKPKAKLAPISVRRKYVYGSGKGKWKGIERILDNPLPDSLVDAFYSGALLSPGKKMNSERLVGQRFSSSRRERHKGDS